MDGLPSLPPITISNYDFDRLVVYGLTAYMHGDSNVVFLFSELERATVCPAMELPDQVVSANCRVIYRIDDEPCLRAHMLVHPCDLISPDDEISAGSPLGIALLGLKVGDRMPFCDTQTGGRHVVAVEGVGLRFVEDAPRTTRAFLKH